VWGRIWSVRPPVFLGVNNTHWMLGSAQTSLNMPGFSLTLLLLPREDEQQDKATQVTVQTESKSPISASEILSLLDTSTSCAAWTPATVPADSSSNTSDQGHGSSQSEAESHPGIPGLPVPDREVYVSALRRACTALIAAEPELTHFDTIAGDGDCGLTFRSGAHGQFAHFLSKA
jgi:dihydroxyacetone kinase